MTLWSHSKVDDPLFSTLYKQDHTVTVILVVLGVLLILAGLAVAGFVAYRRKVQLPGMDRIQSFINPNYRRMAEDSNIVSLRDLSSKQS